MRRFTLSAPFHLRLYFFCPLFVRRSGLVNIYFVNPIIMAAVPTDIVDEVGPRPFVASLLLNGAKRLDFSLSWNSEAVNRVYFLIGFEL